MVLFAKGTPISLRKPIYIVMLLLTLVPIQRFLRGTAITLPAKESFARLEAEWERKGYFSPPEYGPVTGKGFVSRPIDNKPDGPAAEHDCGLPRIPLPTRSVQFSTDSSEACTVVLNVYFYPYWYALTESGAFLTMAANENGLLSVEVPAGSYRSGFLQTGLKSTNCQFRRKPVGRLIRDPMPDI